MDGRRFSSAFRSSSPDEVYQGRLSGPLNSHPPETTRRQRRLSVRANSTCGLVDYNNVDMSKDVPLDPPILDSGGGLELEFGHATAGATPQQSPLDESAYDSISDVESLLQDSDFLRPRDHPTLDSSFQGPRRTDTNDTMASASLESDAGRSERSDSCRICRCEGTPEEPLFYPCKCSGSIKFVHQECLMEWLRHSNKKKCELCKTPFHFTKLYDAHMPVNLPWFVFVQRACWHVLNLAFKVCRFSLVGSIWMIALPWLIRWAWRWMFWLADAGWARDSFLRYVQAGLLRSNATVAQSVSGLVEARHDSLEYDTDESSSLIRALTSKISPGNIWNSTLARNYTSSRDTFVPPQADASILSSWTYVSNLTSSPSVNRILLDVFEGQLITCLVITGFILVFLLREWVVQQQPVVNLEHMQQVQLHLREAAERVEADNERLRRQQQLLEQARQRLTELQDEAGLPDRAAESDTTSASIQETPWIGFDALYDLFDNATAHLQKGGESETRAFVASLQSLHRQVKAAARADVDMVDFWEKVSNKIENYPDDVQEEWKAAIIAETSSSQDASFSSPESTHDDFLHYQAESSTGVRRPPMPERDFSSRATQIQRLLEEAEDVFSQSEGDSTLVRPPRFDSLPSQTRRGALLADDSNDASDAEQEMPVTNAGPDAKMNIIRSVSSKKLTIPPPRDSITVSDNELSKRLMEDEAVTRLERELQEESPANNNPFHPDGPAPDNIDDGTIRGALTSMFREEFGLDEPPQQHQPAREAQAQHEDENHDLEDDDELDARDGEVAIRQTPFRRLAHWFWGDIEANQRDQDIPAPQEERMADDAAQEAPFVPVQNGDAALLAAAAAHPHHDPEVVAAAAQAGINPEEDEEAEELEGILELIGVHGPLIGLLQTSTFCTILVIATVAAAIGLPYVWGKLVLSFLSSPVYFTVKLPLQIASFIADFTLDLALLLSGWLLLVLVLALDYVASAVEPWARGLPLSQFFERVSDFAMGTAKASGSRLQSWFISLETADGLKINLPFLAASVHAHDSLVNIKDEVRAVLAFFAGTVNSIVETISAGSVSLVARRAINAIVRIPEIPARILAGVELLEQYIEPMTVVLRNLRSGALKFHAPEMRLDPSLVYWSSTDRSLAVLAGYLALAALAAVYVAVDTPITRSPAGQRTEKTIRDSLRQAGGVLKVILIISIEMLVFPLYCGLLLDLAFLPLFQGASVATRWAFACNKPYTFGFVHWFVGTCYMFHFALFVGMCRKILRKGVLWFIRDPDDPTFHPVRDVLERNVTTQLRKIAFSALVYGALVILCLGGVIWSIGHVFEGIFPIHWVSTEPVLEFPLDLVLYSAVTPLMVRLFKPSDALNALYGWWLRRCARHLRLSHFLFHDRHKDEEGYYVRKTWKAFLFNTKLDLDDSAISNGEDDADVFFQPDGTYMLTPCDDQYRPPKAGEAFLYADEDTAYIMDKDGKKNEHFAKVYIPPHFRLRVTIFMVCLWVFSAFTGLSATLVPLVCGRYVLGLAMPLGIRVNDIYAYSVGSYMLVGFYYLTIHLRGHLQRLRGVQSAQIDLKAWVSPAARVGLKVLKCAYVYGFTGVGLPVIMALLLQFYFIVPMHTYVSSAVKANDIGVSQNSTLIPTLNETATQHEAVPPGIGGHTIHVLQDYCIGLLYVRVFARMLGGTGNATSRVAEAFRRITSNGVFNPDARLATRFIVAPAMLFAACALLFPPTTAGLVMYFLKFTSPDTLPLDDQTKMYRYSYPLALSCIALVFGTAELAKATQRWRARIRDEVYLVGERLHNFGEKQPAKASRLIVRTL